MAIQLNPKCETLARLTIPLPWLAAKEDQIWLLDMSRAHKEMQRRHKVGSHLDNQEVDVLFQNAEVLS